MYLIYWRDITSDFLYYQLVYLVYVIFMIFDLLFAVNAYLWHTCIN